MALNLRISETHVLKDVKFTDKDMTIIKNQIK